MNPPTLGGVAALTLTLGLTLGLLGLAGCNRPAADSPMSSSPAPMTPPATTPMPDAAASMPMQPASGARP
jgi:hypothetical protein